MSKKLWDKFFTSELKTNLFHSSILFSGNFLAQVVNVIAYPIIARIYDATQFGKFSLFLTISGIIAVIATGRMEYAMMLPKHDKEANQILNVGLYWCLCVSVLSLILSIVLNEIPSVHLNIPGIYLISLAVFLTGLTQLFTIYKNRQKEYRLIAQVSVIQNFTNSGMKIFFGMVHLAKNGLIWGTVLGQLVSVIVLMRNNLRSVPLKFSLSKIKKILFKYRAFPQFRMVQALINTLSSNLPILFLTTYFTVKEAGYFALIAGIAAKITGVVTSAFYQVLYKRFSELTSEHKSTLALYKRFVFLLSVVSILPGILIYIFSDSIVHLVLGSNWIESGIYIRMMILWLITVFIATPFAFMADVFSLQKKVLIIDIVHLLLRIAALGTGLYLKNIFICITLFSITSAIITIGILIWYFYILRVEDLRINYLKSL